MAHAQVDARARNVGHAKCSAIFVEPEDLARFRRTRVPYMTGEYIMNTDRLKDFLGTDYEQVIAKTNLEAFADSFPRN